MKKELQAQNLWDFYCKHVKRLQNHAIQSSVHGIKTDLEMRAIVSAELGAQVQEALNRFHELVELELGLPNYKPNPNSWQQLQDLFYNRLGLKHPTKGTDDDTRQELIRDARTPLAAKEILTAINHLLS